MKRIHLFEFEDLSWFPDSLRKSMTRLMVVMHKLLGTREVLAGLVNKGLKKSESDTIVDLCSGSGGPMPEVLDILTEKYGIDQAKLVMTDLYPNIEFANTINNEENTKISYLTKPIDATNMEADKIGLRTMVSSSHHMKPDIAREILKNAKDSRQTICIFEISDNSYPAWLWWIAIPINIITALVITPFVKPLTFQQLLFTYLIPVLPICFAWDGAVSNARTYTLNDLDILLNGLEVSDYVWEKGIIKGKSKMLYLLGMPKI